MLEEMRERRQRLLELTQGEVGKNRADFGDSDKLRKETVPINVLDIDDILGGGLRKGRMAMVVGHESMGKTLFTQWIIKAFQDYGEICGLIDPEKTYEKDWFVKTGVNVEDLLVVQPASLEQAFDLACLWSANGVGLIVIDSLAALTPQARVDADLADQDFRGLAPRKISEGLSRFTNVNTDSLLVCTNQMRTKLGVVYGSPDEIPGGKAQKFYATYIIKVRRKEFIKDGDVRIGYYMVVETIKNKLAPPFQQTIVPFLFSGVVDTLGGTIDLAVDLGLVPGGKMGWFTWGDERIHGKKKLMEFFHDNSVEFEKLQEMIKVGGGS